MCPSSSSADIWQRGNSPCFWPLWLLELNTLKYLTREGIHFFFFTEFTEYTFFPQSSRNPFFLVAVSTIISGLQKTESEKPHIILTNANLQHQQKILKIKPNQNRPPPPPTPSQPACSSVRKRPIFHMPKPLGDHCCSLHPAQPRGVSQMRTPLDSLCTIRLQDYTLVLLIFTPT